MLLFFVCFLINFSFVFDAQAIRPNMKSFLHTVQKNQLLMMTPNSLGRTAVIKSFIKHTTPMKVDSKVSCAVEPNCGEGELSCITSRLR